ncbi:MAG: site-specific DNA-methyltransferase [Oscillospiraceae bacterium]|nr:site-specific DNA-methyltransferase [Oscillospiraceae bacterium]
MPTLDWIGKSKVVNHHLDVPYHVLVRKYSYDGTGRHEEDNGSENMIIHGDNLLALKSLLPQYEGRIKCIYIDPPYNTGNEGWVYNDNVNDPQIRKWLGEVVGTEGEDLCRHDKWLCMMYPRLKLLHRLCAQDGCIAISIGIHEINNLVAVCKEMFADRQIMPVTVKTSGGKPSGSFNVTHEHIVFILPIGFKANPSSLSVNEESSPFHSMTLASFYQEERPNQAYPIYINDEGQIVSCGKSLQTLIDEELYEGEKKDYQFDYNNAPEGTTAVWPVSNKGLPCVWRQIADSTMEDWEKGYIKVIPQKSKKTKNKWSIQFLSDGIKQKIEAGEFKCRTISDDCPTIELIDYHTSGVNIPTIWNEKAFYTTKGTDQIESIFGSKTTFTYAKPMELIQEILGRISGDDSIILDSFAGSGTTAHAVLNMNKADGGNRKFILIEMMDYADTITAERVKRVIDGYGEGKKAVEGTGGHYSYYELGLPVFNGELLNEEIGEDEIRKYVYYTETRKPLAPRKPEEPAYMGTYMDVAYYFHYSQDEPTTLDRDFLKTIKTRVLDYVIYADTCLLSEAELDRYHITFKKIPRDISRV